MDRRDKYIWQFGDINVVRVPKKQLKKALLFRDAIKKYNNNHDPNTGRFTSGVSSAAYEQATSFDGYYDEDDLYAYFGKMKYDAGLTTDESKCVSDYTGSAYKEINSQLRNGENNGQDSAIQHITNAIEKSPMREDLIVYRGINNEGMNRLMAASNVSSVTELTGTVFKDDGFVSTSIDKRCILGSNDCVLRIMVPKGSKALPVMWDSKNPSENEVLLQRGKSFRVIDVAVSGKKTTVKCIYE